MRVREVRVYTIKGGYIVNFIDYGKFPVIKGLSNLKLEAEAFELLGDALYAVKEYLSEEPKEEKE